MHSETKVKLHSDILILNHKNTLYTKFIELLERELVRRKFLEVERDEKSRPVSVSYDSNLCDRVWDFSDIVDSL